MLARDGGVAVATAEQRDREARERARRRRLERAGATARLPLGLPAPDPRLILLAGAVVVIVVAVMVAINVLGTVLRGPGPVVTGPVTHETPSAIAPGLGVTPEPSAVVTPEPSSTPSPDVIVYIVKSGDSLYAIATAYHTTVAAIVAANGIADPRKLHVGQRLIIPVP